MNLELSRQGREFAEIRDAMIIAAYLGVVKVLQAALEMNFRFSRGHG